MPAAPHRRAERHIFPPELPRAATKCTKMAADGTNWDGAIRHTRRHRMIEQRASRQTGTRDALLAIGVGGFVAGTLDLLQACIQLGWDIPLQIAGGLLGAKADSGGVGTYLLGLFLHFFIALSAAATYYAASRRLPFMTQYPLLCGLYF